MELEKELEVIQMSRHQQSKERVRNFAIEWQQDFPNHNYTWSEIQIYQDMFERLGRRFGLLQEFRENGIC
jgi:hypothetical protein